MKKYSMLFVAGLVTLTASCTKENATTEKNAGETVANEIIFTAAAETVKSVIQGKDINWEASDEIAVYDGSALNTFTCRSAEGKTAEFAGSAAEAASYLAISPKAAAGLEEGALSVTIPSVQKVDATHNVDPAALIAVAQAGKGESLSFVNKFSFAKFEITEEGITSVRFIGNDGEKIAGKAALDASTKEIGAADATTVTVTYGEGVAFPLGVYYAALYPVSLEKGFRMIVGNEDGWKAPNGTSAKIVFARNSGVDFGELSSLVWIPDEIKTAAQLKAWGYISDLYAVGETAKLGADINYGGSEWTPAKDFKGIFDGQNHRIYNFKVTGKQVRAGFIDILKGGTLRNVCFGSSDYDFTKGSAADAGTYDGSSEIVLDYAEDPTGWSYAGISAYTAAQSTISNVVNFVPVSASAESDAQIRLGGISGILKGNCTIENCVNYSQIANNAAGCTTDNTKGANGGICGWTDDETHSNTISGCTNHGDVTNCNPKAVRSGGILGTAGSPITISGCVNRGNVSNAAANIANSYIGGIIGVNEYDGAVIAECVNFGAVTSDKKLSKSLHIGGIAGYAQKEALVKGCTNSAIVRTNTDCGSHAYIGGICGAVSKSTITRSDDGTHTTNAASIAQNVNFEGNVIIGGIAGYCSDVSTFSYCDNSGDVSTNANFTNKNAVTTGVGGICGYNKNASDFIFCTNSGKVTAHAGGNDQVFYVAGILGGKTALRTMTDCSNSATITLQKGAKKSYVGGLCTILNATATCSDCTNSGQVLVNRAAQMYAGCIAARLNVNTTGGAVTICQGCTITPPADKQIILATAEALAANTGLLFGVLSGTSASTTNVGPVSLGAGLEIWLKANEGNSNYATITGENYSSFLVGKTVASDPLVVYNCSVASK